MDAEVQKRPKWEIDCRLEALVGANVRVAAAAFAPGQGTGKYRHLVKASELLLPDSTTANAPMFFEGKLLSFRRQIAVVFVSLEPLSFQAEAANGRVLFRGMPAVILQGLATVQLSHPFFVERIPENIATYWPHLLQTHLQLPLPFTTFH